MSVGLSQLLDAFRCFIDECVVKCCYLLTLSSRNFKATPIITLALFVFASSSDIQCLPGLVCQDAHNLLCAKTRTISSFISCTGAEISKCGLKATITTQLLLKMGSIKVNTSHCHTCHKSTGKGTLLSQSINVSQKWF